MSTPTNPSPCLICLVRHGETDWNKEHRLQGHADIALNHKGIEQARQAAEALRHHRFTTLYCSDLQRAQQTAEAISAHHKVPLRPDSRLRERHYGLFQGLSYEEARQRYPNEFARFQARDPDYALANGGESIAHAAERIRSTLSELAERHLSETILIVSHGGVLDLVYRFANDLDLRLPRTFPILNARLNWLSLQPPQWRLIAWDVATDKDEGMDELPLA